MLLIRAKVLGVKVTIILFTEDHSPDPLTIAVKMLSPRHRLLIREQSDALICRG